jgi:hypothetical protein
MSWVETSSPSFLARHVSADDDEVVRVLELLEETREELADVLGAPPPTPIEVVVHPSRAQLYSAQPQLAVAVRLTAPAARRYLTGWANEHTLHLLTPRQLASRASSVPGSREMALRAPAALYARIALAHTNPRLPPPLRLRSRESLGRWAWLAAGAAQWLGGQTEYARPAINRRLKEGGRPAFPPSVRDAVLLGGTVIDLIAREEGQDAALELMRTGGRGEPGRELIHAFRGRGLEHIEGTWRTHVARLAGQA